MHDCRIFKVGNTEEPILAMRYVVVIDKRDYEIYHF